MTIAQSITIQAYQLHKGGTPARMAILRMIANDSVTNFNPHTRLTPGDWRKARHYTMKRYQSAYGMLSQGSNDNEPVWYTCNGESFRNERDVKDILTTLRYTGWYCDPDGDSICIGIVGMLTHGRYIAGYRLADSGARVYYGTLFDDEVSAARFADSCAEQYADKEREYQTLWREARDIEDASENAFKRLRECLVLRNRACMDYVRDEIRELCETIRTNRERLATEFKEYV